MSSDPGCYPPEYFAHRDGTDALRHLSFAQEATWLRAAGVDWQGRVCDVGCSTGEFLACVGWRGPMHGMELSAFARTRARRHGITFRQHILNQRAFFDVVLFRGTIQHIDEPFRYIRAAFDALRPGGYVAFLQTPNAGSVVYRLWQDLPCLEPTRNWWVPSERTLNNALRNAGFAHVATRKEYWRSPYADPWRDHMAFVAQWFRATRPRFAFHGSMMDTLWQKPVASNTTHRSEVA
jgi:SAM-dependent methyltransferase